MPNIEQAILQGRHYLKEQGISNYAQETAWLLAHVLKVPPGRLNLAPEKRLTPVQSRRFRLLLARRGRHYPLQYLLDTQYFYGLKIKTPPGVLIPRPETETLVEVAAAFIRSQLKAKPDQKGRLGRPLIWDVGTGTGAIALALKKLLPKARVFGSDINAQAIRTAQANARRLGLAVHFFPGSLCAPIETFGKSIGKPGRPAVRSVDKSGWLSSQLDLIVANPPYVTDKEMAQLPRDVRQEPALALCGGRDGLDFYRKLIPQAKTYLKAGGALIVETSPSTWRGVKKSLEVSGYQNIRLRLDDSRKPRVISAQAPSCRHLLPPRPWSSARNLSPRAGGERRSIARAVRALKTGQVVIFPTDTVYGLGAVYDNYQAVKKIFKIKQRSFAKPLPVLIADPAQLGQLGVKLSALAKEYIKKYWPGPLTLILPTSKKLLPLISKNQTVAVRQPGHPLALALLKGVDRPLAVTSANLSERQAPATVREISARLKKNVDLILDGGPCRFGRASTILDLTGPPRIIRPGPAKGRSS